MDVQAAVIVHQYKANPRFDELGEEIQSLDLYTIDGKKHKVVLCSNYVVIYPRKAPYKSSFPVVSARPGLTPKKKVPKRQATVHAVPSRDTPSRKAEKEEENSCGKERNFPIGLTWVQYTTNDDIIVKGKKLFTFSLVGPEGQAILGALLDQEKNNFVEAVYVQIQKARLQNASKLRPSKRDLHSDVRYGSYAFEIGGTYKGEWVKGKPHGKGSYVTPSNWSYTGLWHEIGSGTGELMSPSGKVTQAIWEVTLPESPGVIQKKKEVVDKENLHESGFSKEDVRNLLENGDRVFYRPGEIILREGEVNKTVIWIETGSVAIKKKDPKTQQIRQTSVLHAGNFFGELAALDRQILNCSVYAETDAEIVQIQLPVLLNLFQVHPGLSTRFHRRIAVTLAQRLVEATHRRMTNDHISTLGRKGWNTIKKAVTFSGILLSAKGEGNDSHLNSSDRIVDPKRLLVDDWFMAWGEGDVEKIMEFFSRDIIYLDPYVTNGCRGQNALTSHVKVLLAEALEWKWELVDFFPVISSSHPSKEGSQVAIRARLHITSSAKLWAMMLLSFTNDQISQCEIYFDRQTLDEKRRVASDSEAMINERDSDFQRMFGITNFAEACIGEYEARLTVKKFEEQPGTIYLSSGHVCFLSRVFGLDIKKVIPLSKIDKISPLDNENTEFTLALKHDEEELTFTFSTLDAEAAHKAISALLSSQMEESEPENESYIEKHVRDHQLTKKLPTVRIRGVTRDKGIRVEGPKATEEASSFGTEVCGKSISNYPRMSTMKDGKVIVEPTRQGDPICDQFCLERFENQVIFALADGCNWGWKPRDAAFAASRSFVEYITKNQSGMLNIRTAAQFFFRGFNQAQQKIMEGHEERWWEVGTTTMVGGALVQIQHPEYRWAFVASGVGDCKAYHLHVSGGSVTVEEITIGSRSGENITDAQDPGGRLGPQDRGLPDLRNLSCWWRACSEGDIILVCSDGVHDNLDPQHQGLLPSEFGLPEDEWDKADPTEVEKVKGAYANKKLAELFEQTAKVKNCDYTAVTMQDLVETVLTYTRELTEGSRDFMEKFPDKKLPYEYKQYPGKMDHATCLCMKATKSNLREVEVKLDSYVLRMRHPINGIRQYAIKGGASATGGPKLVFKGKDVVKWLQGVAPTMNDESAENIGQLLLNFKYIHHVNTPAGGPPLATDESFAIDTVYEFQVYEPVLTEADWENLQHVAKFRSYKKGEYIVHGSENSAEIFHIVKGRVKVVKGIKPSEEKKAKREDDRRDRSPREERHHPDKDREKDKKEKKLEKRDKMANIDTKKLRKIETNVDEYVELGEIGAGEIFGEVVFLGQPLPGDIIADMETEVYILQQHMLEILYVKDPSLEGRFYRYLAAQIAQTLNKFA